MSCPGCFPQVPVPGVSCLRFLFPVFDPRIWSALDVSKAEKEIVLNKYNRTIQTAFKEVVDALAVQGTIDEQIAAQRALVEAAEATYRLSNVRYQKGIDNYLSVLDAHRALYAQQQGVDRGKPQQACKPGQSLFSVGRRRLMNLGFI